MNRFITKRMANDNFQKVGRSYQDNLTPDDIKKKLEDYRMVRDLDDVGLNTHIIQLNYDQFCPDSNRAELCLSR